MTKQSLNPLIADALRPFAPSTLSEADREAIDMAMHQDKQPIPGKPLMDGYEKRRQDNALRLQTRHSNY